MTNINQPTDHALTTLGWTKTLASRISDMDTSGQRIARVISLHRGQFTITDGTDEWICSPAGKLLKAQRSEYPVAGDWVLANESVITAVIPRTNLLSRGEAGSHGTRSNSKKEQAIAANIDIVFIVCGLDRDFNIRRLERYLTLVHNCGMEPIVVLTKADLVTDPEEYASQVREIAFTTPIVVSSREDGRGNETLLHYLTEGKTAAMIGSSGAGKSTLANMLYGAEIQQTGSISDSVGKGRHTTTVREIIRLPHGGLLMDNPGIREIAFHDNGSGVESTFSDIAEISRQCRFSDCSHTNEPGCAVLHAVKKGELTQDRLDNFHKMRSEMRYIADRRDKSSDRIEKERWKGVAQMQKQFKKRKYK